VSHKTAAQILVGAAKMAWLLQQMFYLISHWLLCSGWTVQTQLFLIFN